MREVKAVEIQETIFATGEVTSEPGAIRCWCSGARECGNSGEVKDARWVFPFVESKQGFYGEDECELWGCATLAPLGRKGTECIDRERESRAINLDAAHLKSWIPSDRQLDHATTNLRVGDTVLHLVWRTCGRDKEHMVKCE
jgi:hypothetical protein